MTLSRWPKYAVYGAAVAAAPVQVQAEEPHCLGEGNTVFEWNPLSALGGTYHWSDSNNWGGSGYPDSSSDCAWIADVDPASTCTFDLTSTTTIGSLLLQGASPTKMALHLDTGSLTVEALEMRDYAHLIVDTGNTFSVPINGNTDTVISGDIFITNGGTVVLGDSDNPVVVGEAGTRLAISRVGEASFTQIGGITIDAGTDNAARSLKLDGDISLPTDGAIVVRSDVDEDDKRAKFWLSSGEVVMNLNCGFTLTGGNSTSRRAEIDLDESFSFQDKGITSMTGHVAIDIAAGKTFDARQLFIGGPALITVNSGSGASLISSVVP